MPLETSKPTMRSLGKYDLVEKIAEGGMGAVFKGRNRETGEIVALKVVPPHLAKNQTLLQRFAQEYNVASRLQHQNIVRALDYGEEDGSPYLVMEFIDGESLGQKVERDGAMPEAEAIRLIVQVAQGLHRAHKENLIHRDVKPDNVLVTTDGIAKLADLGLVKELDTDLNLTKTGRGLGTPHFMAPEQFRNAKNADIRCDIYSLGATLYMLVTGELPFKSQGPLDAWMKKVNNELVPPRQLAPALTERIDWAIMRSMNPEPNLRPASCREFVEDLTGQSTRKQPALPTGAVTDLWYLIYRDEEGTQHTVKGTVAAIRRSLKEGLLGDASNIKAARSKAGPWEVVGSFPEFRDLVVAPSGSVKSPSSGPASAPPAEQTWNLPPAAADAALPPSRAASSGTSTRTNSRQSTPPSPPPSVTSSNNHPAQKPHLDVPTRPKRTEPTEESSGEEWVKWLLLLGVMLATAVAGYFMFFLGK